MGWRIINADCRQAMEAMDAESVDAIVCDPPYEIGFMGRGWDSAGVAFDAETWRAAAQVLKPGGHLVAFGGTRTHHRIMCAIEDAGFEIRDCLAWMFGSGFPKSHNLKGDWDGWGTALKPAFEPIVLARKPLSERNIALNVARWGTGALNVDGCRVATDDELTGSGAPPLRFAGDNARPFHEAAEPRGVNQSPLGRWPANVVLSHTPECEFLGAVDVEVARGGGANKLWSHYRENSAAPFKSSHEVGTERVGQWECAADCPVRLLDDQSGELTSGANPERRAAPKFRNTYDIGFKGQEACEAARGATSGGASRFYYCAKVSREERDRGLVGFPKRPIHWSSGNENPGSFQSEGTDRAARNNHPTVKPVDLMRWLCRLITPPSGLILDPFCGSGSTGIAALREGFNFIGIEQDADYCEIARARIRGDAPLLNTGCEAVA